MSFLSVPVNWPRVAHWTKLISFFVISFWFQRSFPENMSLEGLWLNRVSFLLPLGVIIGIELVELLLARRKNPVLASLAVYSFVFARLAWSALAAFYTVGPSTAVDSVGVLGYLGSQLISLGAAYLLLVAVAYVFDATKPLRWQPRVVACGVLALLLSLQSLFGFWDYLIFPAK